MRGAWQLADSRLKCRRCGRRYSWTTTAWEGVRVSASPKRQLLELFVLGVPVYRQRFRAVAGAPTARAVWRAIECDETMFGGGASRQERLGRSLPAR